MLSKWQSWDFIAQLTAAEVVTANGLSVIYTADPYLEKIILEKVKRKFGPRDWWVSFGGEVSSDWISTNFINLDLFSQTRPGIIINGELLPEKFFDAITQVNWQENFLLIMFSKETSRFSALAKNFSAHSLMAPRFWETHKLLELLCEQMRVPLSEQMKQYLLDGVENSSQAWVPILNLIRAQRPEGADGIALIKALVEPRKLDQFALARAFNQKNFSDFFSPLLALELDYEVLRAFFNFMENHILKLLDLSYLKGKVKLSQYDLAIKQSVNLWPAADLSQWCRQFAKWEIACKKQDPSLRFQLLRASVNFTDSY